MESADSGVAPCDLQHLGRHRGWVWASLPAPLPAWHPSRRSYSTHSCFSSGLSLMRKRWESVTARSQCFLHTCSYSRIKYCPSAISRETTRGPRAVCSCFTLGESPRARLDFWLQLHRLHCPAPAGLPRPLASFLPQACGRRAWDRLRGQASPSNGMGELGHYVACILFGCAVSCWVSGPICLMQRLLFLRCSQDFAHQV